MSTAALREAQRQQALMAALCHDTELPELLPWLRADAPGAAQGARGLLAYRANAGASAERALAAAYPTVQQLLGSASFAALARALWVGQPPAKGDLAQFGEALPNFIEASAALAEEPYLADCARLDWAVHCCDQAEDAPAQPQGLDLLASNDPGDLLLLLRPGTAMLSSRFPVATIWQAHQRTDDDRFEPVRAAMAAGQGEHALVWRAPWRGQVAVLGDADAAFTQGLLRRHSLAQALDTAGEGFDFAAWLTRSLASGWLGSVRSS